MEKKNIRRQPISQKLRDWRQFVRENDHTRDVFPPHVAPKTQLLFVCRSVNFV